MQGVEEQGALLFEAGDVPFSCEGLQVEDAVTQVDDGKCVVVAIQNHSSVPLHLEEGQTLGRITPVEVSEEVTISEGLCCVEEAVN